MKTYRFVIGAGILECAQFNDELHSHNSYFAVFYYYILYMYFIQILIFRASKHDLTSERAEMLSYLTRLFIVVAVFVG